MSEPGIFGSLRISASGLNAQRTRMNVASQNIANAETTRTEDGTPYQKKAVALNGTDFVEELARRSTSSESSLRVNDGRHMPQGVLGHHVFDPDEAGSVEARIVETGGEGRLVHDPSHPDANKDGYVRYPNVNVVTEMVDLTEASRAYDANATALEAAKQMALRALDI